MPHHSQYDVIIVGAGIVGLTMASLLQKQNLKIAVVDNNEPDSFTPTAKFDLRVSAINRESEKIFRHLDAWKEMQNARVSLFRHIHVWDENSKGYIDFSATELGLPHLGHIIENRVMTTALLKQLETSNITYYWKTTPLHMELNLSQAILETSTHRLSAKLIIGADGAQSWVRTAARIPCKEWDYGQSAIVSTIQSEHRHEMTAWQRFLSKGVLALLPLEDSSCSSMVWSVPHEEAFAYQKMALPQFNHHLTQNFAQKLGQLSCIDERRVFPLTGKHARHYVQPRLALIGDAAHSIHPLAGQGVNLGIQDAWTLAQTLQEASQPLCDYGDLLLLRRYERTRKPENYTMILAMDAFKKLFSYNLPWLTSLRGQGLQMTNQFTWIKRVFMQKAVGYTGHF
jgi:2-octaprenylphenol hydroxylase